MKPITLLNNMYSQSTTVHKPTSSFIGHPAGKACAIAKICKAYAFVKSIWLPMCSNYLIYSGISPGLESSLLTETNK